VFVCVRACEGGGPILTRLKYLVGSCESCSGHPGSIELLEFLIGLRNHFLFQNVSVPFNQFSHMQCFLCSV
jgi:hypothetical protein